MTNQQHPFDSVAPILLQDGFLHVLQECAADTDLIAQFDRLGGHNLSLRGTPIDLMCDLATGRAESDIAAFVRFVDEFVYQPVAAQYRASVAADGQR